MKTNRRDFLKMGLGGIVGAFLSWIGVARAEDEVIEGCLLEADEPSCELDLYVSYGQCQADSTTIYVSDEGSDETGDGSIFKPFATIARAIDEAQKTASAPTGTIVFWASDEKNDEMHHFARTWGEREGDFYIDGQKVSEEEYYQLWTF